MIRFIAQQRAAELIRKYHRLMMLDDAELVADEIDTLDWQISALNFDQVDRWSGKATSY